VPHIVAGSHWLLKRATAEDNKIVIDAVDHSTGEFKAHYSEISDPSIFTGYLFARQRSLLTLLQRNASAGYTAAHVAVASFEDRGWTGSWGDVTGPQVEKFTMTPV
jgi:hypothetical protein